MGLWAPFSADVQLRLRDCGVSSTSVDGLGVRDLRKERSRNVEVRPHFAEAGPVFWDWTLICSLSSGCVSWDKEGAGKEEFLGGGRPHRLRSARG